MQDFDLLYCDFSSIQPDDIVAVDRVSSEYAGEVYMLRPREHYEWYWIDNQRPDEASLFVSYDSAPNLGGAACTYSRSMRSSAWRLIDNLLRLPACVWEESRCSAYSASERKHRVKNASFLSTHVMNLTG